MMEIEEAHRRERPGRDRSSWLQQRRETRGAPSQRELRRVIWRHNRARASAVRRRGPRGRRRARCRSRAGSLLCSCARMS